jgi:hypothetical protein
MAINDREALRVDQDLIIVTVMQIRSSRSRMRRTLSEKTSESSRYVKSARVGSLGADTTDGEDRVTDEALRLKFIVKHLPFKD